MNTVVQTFDLTKYYSKTAKGIENVNLSIKEGEIFGFIGPNGAGKSTTIRTLLNLIYPTRGSAEIFGKDIVKNAKEIRREVGYLPSEVFYYDDMRGRDLLNYSAKFYDNVELSRIEYLANKLQLDMNKKVEDLSFGNRKKLGIVQALLHRPKLIILDEPTSGLDPLMQNIFFELLKEEQENGATVFFSSHILSEVQKLCDRVAIIKEGEILKVDRIEDLRNNQFKRVKVGLEDPSYDFKDLEGVTNKTLKEKELSFFYNGASSDLVTALSKAPIKDFLVEEPSLEEIFMHYYKE